MKIIRLRTNHLKNPLGFQLPDLRVSWVVTETGSACQKAARVEVAQDAAFQTVLYDSGEAALDSLACLLPVQLSPRTRYFWRVTVWGDKGDSATSDTAFFETGKMDEPWQGEWIRAELDETKPHPHMRRTFVLDSAPVSARLYMTGLGIYIASIDGQKVGDEYFAPSYNAYDKWLQVQTYDVTDLLKQGENTLDVLLGNGWAKGRFGLANMYDNYTDDFALRGELAVRFADGTEQVIGTDTKWLCAPSPVMFSSIYDGEIYDARHTIDEGKEFLAKFPDGPISSNSVRSWKPALPAAPKVGPLVDRLSPPIRLKHKITPVEMIETPAGETVLDMGQNMVGLLSFPVTAPAGTELLVQFGEILQDDNFYRDNLRSAKAEYRVIAGDKPFTAQPLFTFFGFRFVKLVGFENPKKEDFTGLVLYSDLDATGSIDTSDARVNRLFQNVVWGQRGNFLDVPTDCPQRDERLGWTGDAQVFSETACLNMDSYAFFTKYLHDMWLEQGENDGSVPHVVPNVYPRSRGAGNLGHGAVGWADAATVIPWTVYQVYGDKTILQTQFDSMRAWVDWIHQQDVKSGDRGLWTTGFHYGDWLSLDNPNKGSSFGGTETAYLCSAYYRYSAQLVANAACVLGYAEDVAHYQTLSNRVAEAMRREYFTPTGRCAVPTQTAMVLALDMHLCPEWARNRIAQDLKNRLVLDGMKLKTGFLGTPGLCPTLSEMGLHEYACRLFMNDEMPGWLYEVGMGATTIWERWNSVLPDGKISDTGMNSLNHYAYGSIAAWMYRYLCGMQSVAPGYRALVLRPRACRGLSHAMATFDSPLGTIRCGWRKLEGDTVRVEVEVPFGATATLSLPDQPDMILQTGSYAFDSVQPLTVADENTPVGFLLTDPALRAKALAIAPQLAHVPEYNRANPISEYVQDVPALLAALEAGEGA